jgi:hypothetical protein
MAVPLCKGLFFLGKGRDFKKTLDKNVILWTERAKILDYLLFQHHAHNVGESTGISLLWVLLRGLTAATECAALVTWPCGVARGFSCR